MAPRPSTLEERAAAARQRADEAEAARLEANDLARRTAAEAVALERALEQQAFAEHVAEYGEPRRAPVNLSESTSAEIQAALGAGVLTDQGAASG